MKLYLSNQLPSPIYSSMAGTGRYIMILRYVDDYVVVSTRLEEEMYMDLYCYEQGVLVVD